MFFVSILTNSSRSNTFMRQQYYDISLDSLFRQLKPNFSLFVTTLQKGMPDHEQQTKVEVNLGAHCPLPPPGIVRSPLFPWRNELFAWTSVIILTVTPMAHLL